LATIIRGEGEAEAAALIAKALEQGPGIVELRKLEAAREIAEILSSSPNVSYLPKEVNVLLSSALTSDSQNNSFSKRSNK
jgi:prohibitin 1